MTPTPNLAPLAQVIDDHIAWLVLWHRLAFMDGRTRQEQADTLHSTRSFETWRDTMRETLPDQPAVDKLSRLHQQVHEMARLVLLKTPDGQTPSVADYDRLIHTYETFLRGIRQLEKGFSVAASGLDALTGLRSRTDMIDDLTREQSRFARSGKSFCIAMMDIDHFKEVNDTYGHDAGDKVLASVADHISRSLRIFDDAYRYGGEEFLICLKDAHAPIGQKVLERLCKSLSEQEIVISDRKTIRVTASFGFVVARAHTPIEELIAKSDEALYKAKEQGRNRVVAAE